MKTAQWMCVATSLAASALQLACGEDSTALGPNGGTSGSWSGAAGSAGAGQGAAAGDGGAAGTTEQAGAAGQSGAGGAPAAARFQVLLEGERLRVVPLDTVSFMACDRKI